MKTSIVRQCSVGLVAGLAFFLGCARPAADTEQPRAVVAPTTTPVVVSQNIVSPVPPAAPAPGEVPVVMDRIPPSNQPATVAMSSGLAEVVKLAQAGVSEPIILAYVEKYSGSFQMGADQILYLKDLGVSETVVTAMLKHHDGAVAANLVQPPPPVAEPPPAPVVTTTVAPPPTSTEVRYFYDALSPYGSWVYLTGYGWCWQPTVAVSGADWRPYSDNGRWAWSDSGWYWNSDYSWGWAAFHYGRWYHHARSGWVWTPGLTWGPSWVSWRYHDGYCGWAPLPPEAYYASGVGFTYFGGHVGIGFEFGLTDYHYCFVPSARFCDYAPYRHYVPRTEVRNIYRNTTVINNYITGNNNTVVNHGIGRETVARVSTTKIREVSVRETPVQNLAGVRGDRVEKQGNQTVVYRPQLPKTPPQVTTASFANRSGGQAPTTIGRTVPTGTSANVPKATTPGQPPHYGKPVVNPGTTGAGNSVGQPATVGRTQPGGNTVATKETSVPNHVAPGPQQHNGKPVNNPATTATVEPKVAPKTQPTANPTQTKPQPPQQQRAGNSLFGAPTANTAPNQNIARSTPNTATVPTTRTYPQTQTISPQTSVRADTRYNAGNPGTMSPRQYEQAPRYAAPPQHQAPAQVAPQHVQPSGGGNATPRSSPESRPAQSGGNGGAKSDSGSGRADRNR